MGWSDRAGARLSASKVKVQIMEAKLGVVPYTCYPSIWEVRGLPAQRPPWAL